MANYSTLKAAVADVVKTNGSQAITGANLQTVLLSIINSIGGGGYIFNGVATPSTDAGTPDQNVFYIGGAGTYANFGTSVVVPPTNIAVFKYNGTWNCEQLTVENGGVFDISAFKATGGTLATYADLAAALGTNGANVPQSLRKGGMSVKYVCSSDNNYIRFDLKAQSFTTDITKWERVNEKCVLQLNAIVKNTWNDNYPYQIGDYIFNRCVSTLRKVTSIDEDGKMTAGDIVPMYNNVLYVFESNCYTWDGVDLIKSQKVFDIDFIVDAFWNDSYPYNINYYIYNKSVSTLRRVTAVDADGKMVSSEIVQLKNDMIYRNNNILYINTPAGLYDISGISVSFKNINANIIDLQNILNINGSIYSYPRLAGGIGDNSWQSQGFHIAIPINGGDVIKIQKKTSASIVVYGLLSAYDPWSGSLTMATGCSKVVENTNTLNTVTAPSDAKYLIINDSSTAYSLFPSTLKINDVEYVIEPTLKDLKTDILATQQLLNIDNKSSIFSYPRLAGGIGDNVWQSQGFHVALPISGGDVINIKKNDSSVNVIYGLLSAYDPINGTLTMATGCTRVVDASGDVLTVTAPSDAKYIIFNDSSIDKYSRYPSVLEINGVEFVNYPPFMEDTFEYSQRPSGGYEIFSYNVDCGVDDIEDSLKSTSIEGAANISTDNACIRLPESYKPSGTPTRLVIINHGAGGVVLPNLQHDLFITCCDVLVKEGYAVMGVNGVPVAFRNTDYLNAAQNGAATNMGGWVALRSIAAAYKYVTKKYNIAKDGCFVIGRSMGGLVSLNFANSGVIPVKGVALDAPVIDIYRDAYFSGGWSGGTLGASTPGIIAWMYQWDGCNFSTNKYSIDGGITWKDMSDLKNSAEDMVALWEINKNKMVGYNAYKTGDALIANLDVNYEYNKDNDNEDKYFGKHLPCPCKIWFGQGDVTNQINIAKRFITKARSCGTIVEYRTAPTNAHTVWETTKALDGVTDISVVMDGITCSPYGAEMVLWLNRLNG